MPTPDALTYGPPVLRLRGQPADALGQALLALTVIDTADGLSRCEAQFANWGPTRGGTGYLFFDWAHLALGDAFTATLTRGTSASDPVFDGLVTALDAAFPEGAPPTITLLAEDRLQDLRMTRRTRTFTDTTDADAARRIAAEHGLAAVVDAEGPTHAVLAQTNQSDLAFLRDRARAIDAEVWVAGKVLHVESRRRRKAGTVALAYPKTLLECSAVVDLARQRTAVVVSGWDPASKTAIREVADAAAVAAETTGGRTGPSVLAATFGARPEILVHTVPLSVAEARARADASMRALAVRFVVLRGVTALNPSIRVGTALDLAGLGDLFSGRCRVTEVRHTFDGARGWRTEFIAERPDVGGPSRPSPVPPRRSPARSTPRARAAQGTPTRGTAARGTSRPRTTRAGRPAPPRRRS